MGRDGVEVALGLTCTCGGIHPGRVEPASPMKLVSSGVGAFISFAAQAKHVQFESAGAAAFRTLPYGLNPGPQFIAQLWHTNPLTPVSELAERRPGV